jgi:hypothetical protein
MTEPGSPFELAAAELRALSISLTRLPGEYRVNYRNGGDGTARLAEDLEQGADHHFQSNAEQTTPLKIGLTSITHFDLRILAVHLDVQR